MALPQKRPAKQGRNTAIVFGYSLRMPTRPNGQNPPKRHQRPIRDNGAPWRIRTSDLWLRRPALYPAELRAQTVLHRRCWRLPGEGPYTKRRSQIKVNTQARTWRTRTLWLAALAEIDASMVCSGSGPRRTPPTLAGTHERHRLPRKAGPKT